MFARLFAENAVPAGCAIDWLTVGVVDRFPVPPAAQAPQVPFPSRQLLAVASPVPSSPVGTSPEIRSAFEASPVSTYCLLAACSGADGEPGSVIGPVMVPPAIDRKLPDPTLDTA